VTELTITAQRGRDLIETTITRKHPNPYTAWAKCANAIDRILGRNSWSVVNGSVHSWPNRCDRW